ncbi:hypothetical protein-transmembrane prediction [Rhodopirellula baltica SH 1]|uniref:Uncharacterized protein n=1 Tax=Rhodopirellula baltica (strain DSM 10527 / NCIMB 13988 / SH1) TaxID=243090 RepID=Q7UK28_RHOBA|nr:hypothetical protein-transmembrane prediction [Rhodopirellula baltica SH 1]
MVWWSTSGLDSTARDMRRSWCVGNMGRYYGHSPLAGKGRTKSGMNLVCRPVLGRFASIPSQWRSHCQPESADPVIGDAVISWHSVISAGSELHTAPGADLQSRSTDRSRNETVAVTAVAIPISAVSVAAIAAADAVTTWGVVVIVRYRPAVGVARANGGAISGVNALLPDDSTSTTIESVALDSITITLGRCVRSECKRTQHSNRQSCETGRCPRGQTTLSRLKCFVGRVHVAPEWLLGRRDGNGLRLDALNFMRRENGSPGNKMSD